MKFNKFFRCFMTLAIVGVLGIFCTTQCNAMDFQQARKDGLVGENREGFVSAISKDVGIDDFVASINAQRKTAYEKISKENGQPVNIVAKLAAEEIIAKLPKGAKYQGPNGEWLTK